MADINVNETLENPDTNVQNPDLQESTAQNVIGAVGQGNTTNSSQLETLDAMYRDNQKLDLRMPYEDKTDIDSIKITQNNNYEIVHGDEFYKNKGNKTTEVLKNYGRFVIGNRISKTTGDTTTVNVGATFSNFVGPVIETYVNNKNSIVNGMRYSRTEKLNFTQNLTDATTITTNNTEYITTHTDSIDTSTSTVGVETDVIGTWTRMVTTGVYLTNTEIFMKGVTISLTGINIGLTALHLQLYGMNGDINGFYLHASAFNAKVIAMEKKIVLINSMLGIVKINADIVSLGLSGIHVQKSIAELRSANAAIHSNDLTMFA